MKNLLLILAIFISSCGGKGGDSLIRVHMWMDNPTRDIVCSGEIEIYYNSKKLHPTKSPDAIGYIIDCVAEFPEMKTGNYTVRFNPIGDTSECATTFKISYRGNKDILLYEGEFRKQL